MVLSQLVVQPTWAVVPMAKCQAVLDKIISSDLRLSCLRWFNVFEENKKQKKVTLVIML